MAAYKVEINIDPILRDICGDLISRGVSSFRECSNLIGCFLLVFSAAGFLAPIQAMTVSKKKDQKRLKI